jgi:hypothetical protein
VHRVAAKRCLQYHETNIKNILILFSTLSYLQNNSDFDVFKKIIEHESGTGVLGLYVHAKNLKLLLTKSSFRRNRT